jgi:hypothetical protein
MATTLNRPLAPTAEGAHVLRPGRYWRLLVVVNGQTDCDELEAALVEAGFDGPVCSTPQDWAEERPDDWPKEPLVSPAANECAVRASGALRSEGPVRFERDRRIGEGATYTIVAAWDYGPTGAGRAAELGRERAEHVGGVADDPVKRDRVLAAVVVALAGLGFWQMTRSSKRVEKEESKFAHLSARADRDELTRRVEHYLSRGHSQDEAADFADREMAAREARRLAAELEESQLELEAEG